MAFEHSKIDDGLNVVTYEMPHVNSISISIIVNTGSRYELPNELGISHFLEHLAFKGTNARSAKDIAMEFDAIGGYFNAYTSRENTVYYVKILKQHFEKALIVLADILQNSLFKQNDIDKELNVITQEINEMQDSAEDLAAEKFYTIAYPNQSLGRSILGDLDVIKNLTKTDFDHYLSKHYTQNNIVISVAGHLRHNNVILLIKKLFKLKSQATKFKFEKANYAGGQHFIRKDLEQTTIAYGFESMPYTDITKFYHAQLLSVILGGGLSSRLFQKVREDLGLAYSIGAYQNSFSDTGVLNIHASCEHEKAELLIQTINNEIYDLQNKISSLELDVAKSQIEASIFMAEERPEYKSEEVGKSFAIFGEYSSNQEIINIIKNANVADILKISAKILRSRPTLITVGTNEINYNI